MDKWQELGDLERDRDGVAYIGHDASARYKIAFELLQTTLNSIGDGLLATDEYGKITLLNPLAEQLTGWTLDKCRGRHYDEVIVIVNDTSHHNVINPLREAMDDNRTVALANSTVLIAANGHETSIESSASPIINPAGRVIGAVLIFRDISARKKSERQAEDSAQFNAAVIASSSDCIKVLDTNGQVMSINDTGCLQMEINDRAQCINFPWLEFWQGAYRKKAQKALEAAKSGNVGRFDGSCATFKGIHKWWEVIITPVLGIDGAITRLLVVSRDITERKDAHSRLNAMYEELQKATIDLKRSNEDLEHFARTASHDLKSPLNAITQLSQLLEMKYKNQLGADADMFIHTIVDCATSMRVLIDDLITYSRVSSGEDKTHPLNSAEAGLKQAIAHLKKSISDTGASISYDPLPELKMSATHILQLFQNLLGNAIHYRSDATPEIHVSAIQENGFYVFGVKDNGIGIAADQLKNIFEPFKRLHGSDKPGSGIGLASCFKIVERAGGRIWVESVEGQGSIFRFAVPA